MTSEKPVTVTITRTFKAPIELVFGMFTEEHHMAQWWGPKDYDNPVCELDVKPQGAIRIDMRSPEGHTISNRGEFVEIDPPHKLVFDLRALEDAEGRPQIETRNTFIFIQKEGVTELHMTAEVTHSAPAVAFAIETMHEGWSQSIDRLERTVNTTLESNL